MRLRAEGRYDADGTQKTFKRDTQIINIIIQMAMA